MASKENIYGLSEGILKACKFLGLEFPPEVPKELNPAQERVPSDYFGDGFEFDEETKEKLLSACELEVNRFERIYKNFSKIFSSQKSLEHNKTDLNIYFCDYLLSRKKQPNASARNYFDFEFYNKSLPERRTFVTDGYNHVMRLVCNDYSFLITARDKVRMNKLFADFVHRDWLDMRECTFEKFSDFVEKHPRFFSKLIQGSLGVGAKIVTIEPNADIKKIFAKLKGKDRLLEEIIVQHESLSAFCPDTVNTVRINTLLDAHNFVHILATSGRFGRVGKVIDNFNGGGCSVVIDPKAGTIISDAVTELHERMTKHPDTGKTFRGFQYPSWEEICSSVIKMAKIIPQLHRVAWDIAINDKGEVVLVEANVNLPGINTYQVPDNTGRLSRFKRIINELREYKRKQMLLLGWRVNTVLDADEMYEGTPSVWNSRRQLAIDKLIPDCSSLMDVGCRKDKFVNTIIPPSVKYYAVDFKAHDAEVIACNFNEDFPDVKVDTCLCVFTAEYVQRLPEFLADMCNAAQKQVLMICRPFDRENNAGYRWKHPFVVDFTEEFLINAMEQNSFQLDAQYPTDNSSVILYDFRRI